MHYIQSLKFPNYSDDEIVFIGTWEWWKCLPGENSDFDFDICSCETGIMIDAFEVPKYDGYMCLLRDTYYSIVYLGKGDLHKQSEPINDIGCIMKQ